MEFVSKFIIYILAVYGALALLLGFFSCIHGRFRPDGSKLKLVLIVKNAGECIEYVVYSMIKKVLSDRSIPVNSVTVIDMDSKDDTTVILGKLRNDFSSIELLKENEKGNIFKDFNS